MYPTERVSRSGQRARLLNRNILRQFAGKRPKEDAFTCDSYIFCSCCFFNKTVQSRKIRGSIFKALFLSQLPYVPIRRTKLHGAPFSRENERGQRHQRSSTLMQQMQTSLLACSEGCQSAKSSARPHIADQHIRTHCKIHK